MKNMLSATDEYKCGHMEQIRPGTQRFYSYLTTRNNERLWDRVLFFGLQYYLKEYLSRRITEEMGREFLEEQKLIVGGYSREVERKIMALCKLGYWPLKIKAVKEGTVLPIRNVLMTITNTLPEFPWTVGFVESLLLKVWYPSTVATCCHKYKRLIDKFFKETVDDEFIDLADYMACDFGYRGSCSEESAEISGGAHLINFLGSDTVPALRWLVNYYNADKKKPIMAGAHASEHAVMCSFERENELAAFDHMLNIYPTGIVSIVSDTFNVYRVLTEFAERLRDKILARDGKCVFRPDSGNPEHIICGDPDASHGSPEWFGAVRLLDRVFGSTMNNKGFRVLNPKVGLIYGDGMYYERYERTLSRLRDMGYAACNLVIGVGGILRNHSRDTLGFALKATEIEVEGQSIDIEKDPITDPHKKSHKGRLRLDLDERGNFVTKDRVSAVEEEGGLLETVFFNGKVVKEYSLDEIRQTVKSYCKS